MISRIASGLRRNTVPLAAGAILVTGFFLVSCAAPSTGIKSLSETDILLKIGDGFYFNDRYEESVEKYSQAIEAQPGLAKAYRNRGYAYLALDEDAKALADFNRAIEISPDFAEAYLGRATLHYRQNAYSEAITDFDRVIELDPWNETARYYKAQACEKVGRLREAVKAYKGYIHCIVPRENPSVETARERIMALAQRISDN